MDIDRDEESRGRGMKAEVSRRARLGCVCVSVTQEELRYYTQRMDTKADLGRTQRRPLRERKLRIEHDLRPLLHIHIHIHIHIHASAGAGEASAPGRDDERARLHYLAPEVVPQRFAPVQPANVDANEKEKKDEKK